MKMSPFFAVKARPASFVSTGLAALILLVGLSSFGCAPEESNASPEAGTAAQESPERAVTRLMGQLSVFSNKVGWALEGQNQPLALFYLDKIDEVMNDLTKVERWEGIPIGGMARATMSGSLQALRSNVEKGDPAAALETYRSMTLACNSCHSATRREYIVIAPVAGDPAPGQQFSAP